MSVTSDAVLSLLDSLREVVWIRAPDGPFLYANGAFEAMYGVPHLASAGRGDGHAQDRVTARHQSQDRRGIEDAAKLIHAATRCVLGKPSLP